MKKADAPPPGWYPDPTGGSQLWWWDGLDWTDHRRAPPTPGRFEVAPDDATDEPDERPERSRPQPYGRREMTRTRDQTAEIMAEVRRAARDEVERAVSSMSDRARDATRRLEPLISQYGDRVMRWIRNLGIAVIALIVLWLLLQTFVQTSLMDWIGDRIDDLSLGPATVVVGAVAAAFRRTPRPSIPRQPTTSKPPRMKGWMRQ